jgi:hypothetical protein
MFTRVLTENERKKIRAYLKADGKRDNIIRTLVMRGKRYEKTILDDLDLLRRLITEYEKQKTR